ncbi:MAG: hypothetical protein PHW76_06670 [Alphaproteobacteria bacterium]|nr:hypothetical protein [Alphaproteobacteria bacterium]
MGRGYLCFGAGLVQACWHRKILGIQAAQHLRRRGKAGSLRVPDGDKDQRHS